MIEDALFWIVTHDGYILRNVPLATFDEWDKAIIEFGPEPMPTKAQQ